MDIKLGISTCPNDTFIFMPMIKGMIDTDSFKFKTVLDDVETLNNCLLYTSPSPRDRQKSRMPSSA